MAEGSDVDEEFAPFHLCEDLVCCVICYEPFSQSRIPKTLTCLHSFCTQCLKGTIQNHLKRVITDVSVPAEKRKPPKDFPCPVCKEMIIIPQNGVAGFRNDFRIQRIKDIVKKSHDFLNKRSSSRDDLAKPPGDDASREKSCGVCKEVLPTDESQMYCLECFKRLCSCCVETHKGTQITADHKIVDVPFTSVGHLPGNANCDVHPPESLRYYCRSCSRAVCLPCTMAEEHGGHDVTRLPNEANAIRNSATNVLSSAQNYLSDMKNKFEKLQTVEKELKEKETSVRRAILSKTLEDIFRAKQRQSKMEKDLEGLCQQKYRSLQQHISQLREATVTIEKQCTFMTDILEHGEDLQIMRITDELLPDLEQNCSSAGAKEDIPITEFTNLGKYDNLLEELDMNGKLGVASPSSVLSEIRTVVSEIRDLSTNQMAEKLTRNKEEKTQGDTKLDTIVLGKKGSPEGEFCFPSGVGFLDNGDVAVTDMHNHRVKIFGNDGTFKRAFGSATMKPCAIAVTRDGCLAVTDCCTGDSNIKVYTPDGKLKTTVGKGIMKYPFSIVIDDKERYIVCDTSTNCITILRRNGELFRRFGTKTKFAFYLAVNHRHEILLSDWFNHCIKVFDTTGLVLRRIGTKGTKDGELMIPLGVTTDHLGNVIVMDCKCGRVSKFSPDGRFIQHILEQERFEGIRHARAIAISGSGHLAVTTGDNRGSAPNEVRIFQMDKT